MAFKRSTTDHLSDDPIIRGDIANRVSTAVQSNGNAQLGGMGTDRPELHKQLVKPERPPASSVKITVFVGAFLVLALVVLGFFVLY
ncbi:hypothetical protein MESS2_1080022 [Mesorhizobium metallidurans STM 2683]|uniref:Transmembrane protein n=1 Tax=Mesorhizobium metallidurans STM 2683 TaxID=1297569 RepID=M5EGX8_9HYPH|nr:hypothetical protein [Mesorhizobium metallidurans]CCV03520.1 hypothetical protein MESS2_1080022 [Mesorhizobium metallidurans STM 2683]